MLPGCVAEEWNPSHAMARGSSAPRSGVSARLPQGTWLVKRFDVISPQGRTLSEDAACDFTFDAPDSRAALFLFKEK